MDTLASKCAALVLLQCSVMPASAVRLRPDSLSKLPDGADMVDMSNLFYMGPETSPPMVYKHGFRRFRCCCDSARCALVDLASGICTGLPFLDADQCGCAMGPGSESFHRRSNTCLVAAQSASSVLRITPHELAGKLEEASTTRYVNGWKVSYGQCSASCGYGKRQKIAQECPSESCGLAVLIEEQIPCTNTESCQWKCSHTSRRPCGWGTVTCRDGNGDSGQLCKLKAEREQSFDDEKRASNKCFKSCQTGDGDVTFCSVTSNHLDEQYGSLSGLVTKTCFAGGSTPVFIAVLTQELNHANYFGIGADNFPTYVYPNALRGYILAGECRGKLSANSALFVREDAQHHVLSEEVWCSGSRLRSDPCDYTNCKGSTVMSVPTSSGKLVVANWHGARAGTLSHERVQEFEKVAMTILDTSPFKGKKLVILGGDINVRSDFGPKGSQLKLDLTVDHKPRDIVRAMGGDVLGVEGWTVDQHLNGTVGLSSFVKKALRRSPLMQAKGWNTLCPTKTKKSDPHWYVEEKVLVGWRHSFWGKKKNRYRKVQIEKSHLRCRSPKDQTSTGRSDLELVDFKKKWWGQKSSAPSWTERFFLNEEMYNACGKVIKDIRNQQDDHDALYVHCVLPAQGKES